MAYEVRGKAPVSEVGERFQASVWTWRPLWTYCEAIAPGIAGKVENAQYNDGDGLDAADAEALGEALVASVERGLAERCVEEFQARAGRLPDQVCPYCDGTGINTTAVKQTECYACCGTGKVRPLAARYRFSVEPVEQFAAFCCESGGFEIW